MDNQKLIEVKNVKKSFPLGRSKTIRALDDISFDVYKGEFLGVVGESGSGKSTLGKCIAGIKDIDEGEILFNGTEISGKKKKKYKRNVISRNIQFIFQDSSSSINSRMSIEEIIAEPMRLQKVYNTKEERTKRIYDMLELVGLDRCYANQYPYDFSGGQRQRINIARALSVNPSFIIADEPIASLDMSMQAQIINLFKKLKNEKNLTCMFISHDLSMVRYISDRIAVIYKGRIVEIADTEELYNNPIHPYTRELIGSMLTTDMRNIKGKMELDFNYMISNYSKDFGLVEVERGHFVDLYI